MQIKIKSKDIMGDYIALHGLVPNNELPKWLHNKIPNNQIWIRQDVYDNKFRFPFIRLHEKYETKLMKKGMKYKDAHRRAEIVDGLW